MGVVSHSSVRVRRLGRAPRRVAFLFLRDPWSGTYKEEELCGLQDGRVVQYACPRGEYVLHAEREFPGRNSAGRSTRAQDGRAMDNAPAYATRLEGRLAHAAAILPCHAQEQEGDIRGAHPRIEWVWTCALQVWFILAHELAAPLLLSRGLGFPCVHLPHAL